MSNVEQGISNDEVQYPWILPSAFIIRYSIFCGSLLNLLAKRREMASRDSEEM